MMPIVVRHAISGHANINSEDPLWEDNEALAMLIDVFSERGYQATVDIRRHDVPLRFDLTTGDIENYQKKVYRFVIRFAGSVIRRGS
jgi:adenylate kinase